MGHEGTFVNVHRRGALVGVLFAVVALLVLAPAALAGPGLNPGESLYRGESRDSTYGQYRLSLQGDGNLVDTVTHSARPLWASGTAGKGYRLVMQHDGNLVLYNYYNQPVWASNTAGHPGAYLALQRDANLVIYWNGRAIWASGTYNNSLRSGEYLRDDHYIRSSNGKYQLYLGSDGNLVLYNKWTNRAAWATRTNGAGWAGRHYAWMQGDGNFVLYAFNGSGWYAPWATWTQNHPGARLVVQNDGNVVVYRDCCSGVAYWSSNTVGAKRK
jgi:hypothetical protein